MMHASPSEKVYPVSKIAIMPQSLQAEDLPLAQALDKVELSENDLTSPEARVSLNQLIQCSRNAIRLSADPHFAYRAGLRLHVAT
jgi:hypothetical protein